MLRTVRNVTAALALAGLVISQPAMAIRSSEALPAPGAMVSGLNSRVGSPMGHKEHIAGVSYLGWAIVVLLITGAIIIIVNDHHETKSPG